MGDGRGADGTDPSGPDGRARVDMVRIPSGRRHAGPSPRSSRRRAAAVPMVRAPDRTRRLLTRLGFRLGGEGVM